MEDTKESSKPAGQTSNTSPPNTINIEQSSDVFKKNNVAQKHHDDASPTFGSNMPSRTDSDSSYQISDFTLLGARPKNTANSSSTLGEVVSVGTFSTNHSMKDVSEKKDFAVPANEAVVHPSGNAHETQSQSNKDNHPLAVNYPVMEELETVTGPVKKKGNIFIMKNKFLGRGIDSFVYEGRLESLDGLPVAVKCITYQSQYMASKTRKDVDTVWKNLYRGLAIHRDIEKWRHPNIVGYYHSHVASNKLYIAFQLCQGDLENYIKQESKFNISPLEVNRDMAEGIKFLHSRSIVHRDLKPQNVFLVCHQDLGCRAVIGDLGMSKATNKGMFSASNHKGSIGYMAPEVYEEESSAGQGNNEERPLIQDKCDIFSLGLLFFFATTNGNHPFGTNYLRSQMKIIGDCQPNFDQIKPEDFILKDLLEKMTTYSPGSRPTAEEVCKHPALWDNEVILDFFKYCNGKVEAMANEGKPVDKIVPNNILPHGNWMRDLPNDLRKYLKEYRVNGKLPYQGKQSSTRYLLRAIRNTEVHLSDLSQKVIDDLGEYRAVFWKKKFPELLTHLYKSIDHSDFTPVKDKKAVRTFPRKETSLQNKSASNALAQMDDGQSAGNQRFGQQITAAVETRPMPVQRGTTVLTATERLTLGSSGKIIHPRVPFNNTTEEYDDSRRIILEHSEKTMKNSFNIHGRDCNGTGKTGQIENVIEHPYCPLQSPSDNDHEDMCNLPSASYSESRKEIPFPSSDSLVITNNREENLLTGRETMATDYNSEQNELLQKLPTDSALANLAEKITDHSYLAKKLKMSSVEVKKVQHDHSQPLSNFIYHILHEWKKKGNNYLTLYHAMKDAEYDTTFFFQIIAEEETDEEKQNVEKIMGMITDDDDYELSDHDINGLLRCIGKEYWLFGIRLGLTETDMQHISMSYGDGPSRVRKILVECRKRCISIRKLILAMVRSSCDIPEIIKVFQPMS